MSFGKCSKGKEKLWKVFWIYGLVYPLLFFIFGMAIVQWIGTIGATLLSLIVLPYHIWFYVSLWRCAFNTSYAIFGYLARISVVVIISGIVCTILLLSHKIIEHVPNPAQSVMETLSPAHVGVREQSPVKSSMESIIRLIAAKIEAITATQSNIAPPPDQGDVEVNIQAQPQIQNNTAILPPIHGNVEALPADQSNQSDQHY